MTIFLVDLESVSTRYTCEWKTHLPHLLRKAGHNVQIISGPEDIPTATTPGAFLNFGGTNIYKSSQVVTIGLSRSMLRLTASLRCSASTVKWELERRVLIGKLSLN